MVSFIISCNLYRRDVHLCYCIGGRVCCPIASNIIQILSSSLQLSIVKSLNNECNTYSTWHNWSQVTRQPYHIQLKRILRRLAADQWKHTHKNAQKKSTRASTMQRKEKKNTTQCAPYKQIAPGKLTRLISLKIVLILYLLFVSMNWHFITICTLSVQL